MAWLGSFTCFGQVIGIPVGPLPFWVIYIPALAIAAVVLMAFVSRKAAWGMGILNVFVVVPLLSFSWGVISYSLGTAKMWGVGLPGPEFRNLDREARCPRVSSG